MISIIKLVVGLVNNLHDVLIMLCESMGYELTDKELHFWIIGLIGIIFFFVTDLLFKKLAKLNVSIISFIYTFTILVVIVFSLEIEQKVTNRGQMDFNDIVAGLWGFFVAFSIFLSIKLVIFLGNKLFNRKKTTDGGRG